MPLPSYVGRYEVRDEIATGGFGVVLRAWDEELESLVALKILLPSLAEDADIRDRFLEEARLLRRIRSPHVVTVHDVGRLNDGRPYFVMDYADRGTLQTRLRGRGGTDPQEVLQLADAVADGLTALHEAGVIHRDVKPDNILFQVAQRGAHVGDETPPDNTLTGPLIGSDERILLGDLGIAKDMVKGDGAPTIIGGTPLYRAPEQTVDGTDVTRAADIYAATALLWHVLTGTRPPHPGEADGSLSQVPESWHKALSVGMQTDPRQRFADMEIWRAAVHEAATTTGTVCDGDQPTQAAPRSVVCPYKGLAAYEASDARYFFGREALIDELVRRLQRSDVLVVGGPSGSGKSSLLRAGLVPALRAGALPGSGEWQTALFTPGRDPLAELHFQVTRALGTDTPALSLEEFLSRPTMARHLGCQEGVEQSLLLCIDQFEELFTLAPAAQRVDFVAALSAMTDPADSLTRLVIAVRADFYGNCAQLPWLAEAISHNQVLVGPMSSSELRRAISEPARRAGLYLERNLVDTILDEAGSEAGSLPLVAHALVETWNRRQGNALTLEGFRAAGGVAGAISQTADETYEQRFDDRQREAGKNLFLRLVSPGEGTPDTRRLLSRSEIDNTADSETMHSVVQTLTEARLLTLDDANVAIAHEALLRIWPRLKSWIEESRDDLRTRQRISRAALEWEAENRDADLLYRGTPLLSAQEWMQKHPEQIGTVERAFLEASIDARDRARSVAAERARRSRRVRRIALAALAFLALGTTGASMIAFLAYQQAQQNETRAELAGFEAKQRFASALGAVAHGLVETDPLLALALASESAARAEIGHAGFDARSSLITARRTLAAGGPILMGSPIDAGDAMAIALSPDGALVAVGQRSGAIVLIDTASRTPRKEHLLGHVGGVRDLEFDALGKRLLSAGVDRKLRLWNVEDDRAGPGRIIGETADVAVGICLNPLDTLAASADGGGAIQLWDLQMGGPLDEPLIRRSGGFNVVEISPDGTGIVASSHDAIIYGWALPSRESVFPPLHEAHSSHLIGMAFAPSGDLFATVSTDGTSQLISYPRGLIAGRAFDDTSEIRSIDFSADGRWLIGGTTDGNLKLWDMHSNTRGPTSAKGHSRAVVDLELNAEGTLLATLGQEQTLRLWSMQPPYPTARSERVSGKAAKSVAISPDGRRLAAGDDSGTVQVWNLERPGEVLRLKGHEHQVWAVAFSPDSQTLVSADRSGELRQWQLATGSLERHHDAHSGSIWSVGFSPDGQRMVTAGDAEVRIWSTSEHSLQGSIPAGEGRNTRARISPDGRLLAIATSVGRVDVWDMASQTLQRQIDADDNLIWSIAFSPDSTRLVTASSDEVIALWDLMDGHQIAVFTDQTGGATDVAYLADGATIVAVDRSGGLHFWDTDTGRRLSTAWRAHERASWALAVHPDGQRFATAGDDGYVKLWDELDTDLACRLGKPALDAVRRDQYLGAGEQPAAC